MTQYLEATSGNVTPEMIAVAQSEFLEPEFIRNEIADGRLVIPANTVTIYRSICKKNCSPSVNVSVFVV